MRKGLVWLLVAGMAGAVLSWWFSPTQMLKRRTGALMELMTFDGPAGAGVMDVYSLSGLLCEQVMFEVPVVGDDVHWASRTDCEVAYNWLCDHARESEFEVLDYHSVEVVDGSARVDVRLRGRIELPDIRMLDDEGRVEFRWTREQDHWRLREVRWLGGR